MHRERMPLQLKTTIRNCLSKTFLNQRYVPGYISELSGSLKREMYLTLFKDLIVKVPFFSDWSNTAITEIVEHFRLKVIVVKSNQIVVCPAPHGALHSSTGMTPACLPARPTPC